MPLDGRAVFHAAMPMGFVWRFAMSVFTDAGSQLLSQNQRAPWLVEGKAYSIEIAALMAFREIFGFKLEFGVREAIDIDGDTNPADTLTSAVSELQQRDESPDGVLSGIYSIGELGTSFTLPYYQQDTLASPNDLESVAGQMAIRRLTYLFFKKMSRGAGSGANGDFNGLLDTSDNSFLTADQTVSLFSGGNAGTLTLPKVDEAF
jgi:hypothetical protein